MIQQFKKKSFRNRLSDTGFLIRNSFTIVGKDKDIKTPSIRMIVLSLIITMITYSSFLFFFLLNIKLGALLFLTTLILRVYRYFFNVREKAKQSWIVYNTACGKDISYNDAHVHTKVQRGRFRIIALVDFLMKRLKNTVKRQKKGFLNFIIQIAVGFLMEVWDLLSHYMLPAIVIEQKSMKELVPEMKSLKKNIPATLVGVFGIDFVGNVVNNIFNWLKFFGVILGLFIGHFIAQRTDFCVIHVFEFTNVDGDSFDGSFCWIPIYVLFFTISILKAIFKNIVDSIKVIYFTIFYTAIRLPDSISPEMKEELNSFLLMKDTSSLEEDSGEDLAVEE